MDENPVDNEKFLLDTLKALHTQEIDAKNRYDVHIALLIDDEIAEVFKRLKKEEANHEKKLFSEIKKIDSSYSVISQNEKSDYPRKITDYETLRSIIEINIEKEKIASERYMEFSKKISSPYLKQMILEFRDDELVHKDALNDVLNKVKDLIEN
jgi:rubrerythrin